MSAKLEFERLFYAAQDSEQRRWLSKLTPRQEHTIRSYYGIGCSPRSHEEIGQQLDRGAARISQIRRQSEHLLMGFIEQERTPQSDFFLA